MTSILFLTGDLPPREFHARLGRRVRGVGARRGARHRGRRIAMLAAAVAVPALAAPQGWNGALPAFAIGDATANAAEIRPMPFEQAGASFPGSAFYYLAAQPAPSPALDSAAHWDSEEAVGPAAQSLPAAGTAMDRTRALTCLTQAIYYEAASEPDAGQRAVAQVVLNRVAHPAFPKTVCGVVYQGSERSTGCQFSFTCDGALARVPSRLFWERAQNVARAALSGQVYAPVGLATHYHTIAIHPYWADSLAFLGTIGAHRFYRLGGPAGASGMFSAAAYRGGEPAAAPLPRVAGPAPADLALDPVAIERAYAEGFHAPQANALAPVAARAPAPAPAPAYAPELAQRGGDRLYAANALPQGSAVRPEYARSGQWIAQPAN
ncbi:cell wall hydrolase [Novosphingobium bradum]|uniref:Cell wall hydrolase n=1 Tax=Novosphingobium bradum TaxID=1737444 RepID=A0ABV7INA2_9SPHN